MLVLRNFTKTIYECKMRKFFGGTWRKFGHNILFGFIHFFSPILIIVKNLSQEDCILV